MWRLLTFTATEPYVYPVASLKRRRAYCDDNIHKHESNVSTPRYILQVTKIRVKSISTATAFKKNYLPAN